MKQSSLFFRTRRAAPQDEVSRNAILLIRAGFVHKELAGVYSFLPLGLKVMEKIAALIRAEMSRLGAQEVLLSALQNPESWRQSGRWDDRTLDIWFKTRLQNQSQIGLAPTHEEPLTALLRNHLTSYKELPFSVFQIQTKFRNERRAKSGLLRGREFLMKDLYSFSLDRAQHQKFYDKVKRSYLKIFRQVGLTDCFLTLAGGGSFSRFSHEFQVPAAAGEDIILLDRKKRLAVNKEVFSEEILKELNLSKADLQEQKSIEVGNIFELGARFSESLGLFYLDGQGRKKPVFMGSYGIGLGRLLGVVAETCSDDRGLVWPPAIAPFSVHLLALGQQPLIKKTARNLYDRLVAKGFEVLYDDRDNSAGEKLTEADLIGLPWRLLVSQRTVQQGLFELKKRNRSAAARVSFSQLLKKLRPTG